MLSLKVNIKKSSMALVSTLLFLLLAVSAYPIQAADANKEYAISFSGGEGTIQVADTGAVDESYTVKVPYAETVDLSIITAIPPTGYYFTGWSPEVETTVTQKANYVAQYARIINEGVYRVRYMDNYGN
ncbi:MAG: InlB B-repeat-containing protein [Eubacterium aggregans]